MGEHDLASSVSDQSSINHVNTDFNNDDDSRSFETPWKNNRSFTSLVDTKTKTTTPNLSNLLLPGKGCVCFQTEGKTVWATQFSKSRASTKVTEKIFENE